MNGEYVRKESSCINATSAWNMEITK